MSSNYEPKSSADLTGWTEIGCWQAEIVRRDDLQVACSRTDMDTPDVFTEWWTVAGERIASEVPVLREYRDRRGCRHYLADEPRESAHEIDTTRPHAAATSVAGEGLA